MRAKNYSVSKVLIGTHRVGLVGLQGCLRAAEKSGLGDREAIVDFMMEELSASNYLPEGRVGEYRTAVWREYLRHRGEDLSAFYSEIPVIVRGGTDENRDRLARMTTAALAEHELRPSMTINTAVEEGAELVLEINGEEVVCGLPTLDDLRKAVRHRLSDW